MFRHLLLEVTLFVRGNFTIRRKKIITPHSLRIVKDVELDGASEQREDRGQLSSALGKRETAAHAQHLRAARAPTE
jgi:hypothetical protein